MTGAGSSHRVSTCHRHPVKPITGFCSACLSERLSGIDPATRQEIPTAAHLRRSKSHSASTRHPSIPEPRRNSCDVNTLWDLLHAHKNPPPELGLKEPQQVDVMVQDFDDGAETKTMKEHIDLDWRSKKSTGRDLKDIAGSFWQAASVFSKKLRKWRGKQKLKESGDDPAKAGKSERRCRETQSEVGDYGLGRRSCDADPRMSLDAAHYGLGSRRSCDADPRMSGRVSCDDVRYSLDLPRASWDGGYLMGRAYPRLSPLVSVVEDVRVPSGVEEEGLDEEQKSPGGSAQTRDYYSLQRRRRSFDRRPAGLEVEELKSISNAKITPETIGLFHGAKLLITEKELMESNWNQPSGASHSSESSRSASSNIASVPAGLLGQKGFKKLQGWHKVWHIWGSIQKQKQGENKCEAEDKYLKGDAVDRPLAGSLEKLRRVSKGEGNEAVSKKLIRSYSVSSRNSYGSMAGLVHDLNVETKGNVSKRREELALQRNRSAPYSPTNVDNGLLRFYLTPLRSGRVKSGKSRLKTSHTISRNVL